MLNLTFHTVFPAEPDTSLFLLTSRRTWPIEETALPTSASKPSTTVYIVPKLHICKPRGEVSEVNKGGYSLRQVLGWEKTKYLAVQVRFLPMCLGYISLNIQVTCIEIRPSTSFAASRHPKVIFKPEESRHIECLCRGKLLRACRTFIK